MLEILKIIHFLSFSIAIGASVANIMVGMRIPEIPVAAMPQVGAIRLSFGKASTFGLILLWLTGIALVANNINDPLGNFVFQLKLAAVLVLTVISVMANMTVAKARAAGAPPNANRMRLLGLSGLIMAIAALILAVFAFT